MPELVDNSIKRTANYLIELNSLQDNTEEEKLLPKDKVEEILKKEDLSLIGAGGECVVVVQEVDSKTANVPKADIVIAIDYKDIETSLDAKKLFYVHRIMSTLFPHNFPHFFTSYGSSTIAEKSGTIRQRIYEQTGQARDIKYSLESVDNGMKEMGGFPIDFDFWHPQNYMIGEDGGEYYVDKIRLDDKPVWHSDKILAYMEKNKYDSIDQRIVIRSIARLNELTGTTENT